MGSSEMCSRSSSSSIGGILESPCAVEILDSVASVKEKAAPVAPAVAPVVLGVGTAVLFKSGLSAVIKCIEDMPSDQSDSSSSESDLSDDGGSGDGK